MDDLVDLDWGKKPAQGHGSLASLQQQSRQPQHSGRQNGASSSYNFDALTRSLPGHGAGASSPSYNTSASRTNTARLAPQQHRGPQAGQGASTDAFSSLLGGLNGNSSPPSQQFTTQTLAQRLRSEHSPASSQQGSRGTSPLPFVSSSTGSTSASAWDGLDDFLGGSSSTTASKKASPSSARQSTSDKASHDDLWDFTAPIANTAAKAAAATASTAPRTLPSKDIEQMRKDDPFDFAEFEDPGAAQSSALGAGEASQPKSRTTEARWNDAIAGHEDYDDDDDDLLGGTGRPQQSLASRQRQTVDSRPQERKPRDVPRSGPSPPPHVVGQLVEMGFGPVEARRALAQTADGKDVTTALESLMRQSAPSDTPRQGKATAEDRDREYALRLQREEERAQSTARRRTAPRPAAQDDERAGTPDWQKQADELYAQASDFGTSVFKSANALWSQAKAQAQKTLDERSNASGSSSGRASPAVTSERLQSSRRWAVPSRERKDWQGKPKWMMDAESEASTPSAAVRGPAAGSQDTALKADDFSKSPVASASQDAEAPIKNSEPETILWDLPETSEVRAEKVVPAISTRSVRTQAMPAREPIASRAAEKKARHIAEDSTGSLATSDQHKTRGNECFKRGAYADADAAYSAALDVLGARSLRRVTLLNNRAQARLKSGDAHAALKDVNEVLMLIVVGLDSKASPSSMYKPSTEAPLPSPACDGINLRDGYAKALLRRAQAEEMLEHWETAHSVWSLLDRYEKQEGSSRGGVSNMRMAQDGKGRCSKMLNGAGAEAKGPVKGVPVRSSAAQAAAASAMAKAEQAAKERIRAENAAAAAEASARDALRDSVDARILSWKTGKENNVRALLASLHEVVWPGLGWKRVGMHELVMDNQVKKVYMRAIGKLHPDKLTPRSSTVEERMLGGSAFAVLNEAWALAQTA